MEQHNTAGFSPGGMGRNLPGGSKGNVGYRWTQETARFGLYRHGSDVSRPVWFHGEGGARKRFESAKIILKSWPFSLSVKADMIVFITCRFLCYISFQNVNADFFFVDLQFIVIAERFLFTACTDVDELIDIRL